MKSISAEITNNLAALRKRGGWSASALAAKISVSRQAIYSIEAGTYAPNTALSLRLAQALGVGVEEIFRLKEELQPALKAEVILEKSAVRAGQTVQLCRIDGRLIAVEPSPPGCYLPLSDGVAGPRRGSKIHVRPHETGADFEGRLMIAGCDPAASILAKHSQKAGVQLIPVHQNSLTSLSLLKQHRVHIAGTHMRGNSAMNTRFRRGTIAVFSLATWHEGLITAPGNPKRIKTIEDLGRKGIRFINRETGAGTRVLLDSALARLHMEPSQIRGYKREARGHLAAASEVQMGTADCCIATEAAARAFDLAFIPLETARYDLVIRRPHLSLPALRAVLEVIVQANFRRELSGAAGYETAITGSRVI